MPASLRQAGCKTYLKLALSLGECILLASESFFVQILRIHEILEPQEHFENVLDDRKDAPVVLSGIKDNT